MSKALVSEFIDSVIDQKVEQLMGITLDKIYWVGVIGGQNIDKLRKDLSAHQAKVVKSAKGQVIKDNRDIDKINELTKQIDGIERASQELQRLNEMERQIKIYMDFCENIDEATSKTLEKVAKKSRSGELQARKAK